MLVADHTDEFQSFPTITMFFFNRSFIGKWNFSKNLSFAIPSEYSEKIYKYIEATEFSFQKLYLIIGNA